MHACANCEYLVIDGLKCDLFDSVREQAAAKINYPPLSRNFKLPCKEILRYLNRSTGICYPNQIHN